MACMMRSSFSILDGFTSSSSSYIQASPLCEAYWLGMCVCLCCGNKGAEGKEKIAQERKRK